MSTIANIYTGNSINETEKQRKYVGLPDGYNYIATKDVSFDHIVNYENGVKIPLSETNFKVAYKDTPLLCIEGGSAGRKIAILEQDVCFGNKLCAFQSLGVNPKYLYYYLQNHLFIQVFKAKTTGIIGGVSVNTLKTLIFALPPLSEQSRIVEEIERFEPLLTEYDKLEQQVTKLDTEIYDKLKKSILQYAIQGKLVEQDENDEPASVLLERIRAEKKAQLGKKYVESYIYKGDDNCYYEHIGGKDVNITEEIPFDLPNGWEWTRLSDVIDVRDGTHDTPQYVEEGYPLITGKDFYNGNFNFEKTQYISKYDYDEINKRSRVDIGDILFSMIGGNIGSMIKISNENYFEMAIKNVALFKQYSPNDIISSFLFIYLKSQIENLKKAAKGGAQPFVPLNFLRTYLFPLPPLAEQKRIVDKINEIFAKL